MRKHSHGGAAGANATAIVKREIISPERGGYAAVGLAEKIISLSAQKLSPKEERLVKKWADESPRECAVFEREVLDTMRRYSEDADNLLAKPLLSLAMKKPVEFEGMRERVSAHFREDGNDGARLIDFFDSIRNQILVYTREFEYAPQAKQYAKIAEFILEPQKLHPYAKEARENPAHNVGAIGVDAVVRVLMGNGKGWKITEEI